MNMVMRLFVILMLSTFAVFSLPFSVTEDLVFAEVETGIDVGQKASPFKLLTVDGKEIELGSFARDRVTLLVFGATWCPSCIHEIPLLKEFYSKEVKLVIIRNGKELTFTLLEQSKTNVRNKKDLFESLGLAVQNLTGELAVNLGYEGEKGVIITNIANDDSTGSLFSLKQEESPAFKAGLNKNDLIVKVQDKPVTNIDEFHQAILKIKDDSLLNVLAIDIKESVKKVKSFVEKQQINYPVVLDSNADVARLYKVVGIPLNIILDKNGVIVYKENRPPSKELLKDLL